MRFYYSLGFISSAFGAVQLFFFNFHLITSLSNLFSSVKVTEMPSV